MTVSERIADQRAELTRGERLVAAVVLDDPQAVAFGTVADVATRAGTSGPTVLRLATRLGFDGFVTLQKAVQDELGRKLRPAAQRIRQRPVPDALQRTLEVEAGNVQATLEAPGETYARAVRLLARRTGQAFVISGDATYGVAHVFASELSLLRPGVELVTGSPIGVARSLAHAARTDAAIVIDLRRYERWVVEAMVMLAGRDLELVAVTDSLLSPIAASAGTTFVVSADGAGPFDSHVGTLAMLSALVTGVAARLRHSATDRLDRVEEAWRASGALLDDDWSRPIAQR